jgi:hypothetical protein
VIDPDVYGTRKKQATENCFRKMHSIHIGMIPANKKNNNLKQYFPKYVLDPDVHGTRQVNDVKNGFQKYLIHTRLLPEQSKIRKTIS